MAVQQWIAALALAGGVAASASAGFGATVRPVFLSGAAAPAGLTFASFGRAAVNARGTLCFTAGWDSLLHRPEGLFLRRGGQVLPIARAGDPIPSSPGDHFSFPPDYPDQLTSFSLNNQDQVAFIARQGLFLYSEGAVQPVAPIGGEVPGAPDERWDEIDAVSLNNSGAIAFAGAVRSVQDGSRQEGVFLAAGGSVQIVLFDGDPVPNLDGVLDGFSSVSLNDAGKIATLALEGDAELTCVLLTSADGTSALAVEGQPAPGGGIWTELDSAALNNPGTVVFAGRAMTGAAEQGGIYESAGGNVTPVALPGQTVSGAGGGTLVDDLGRPVPDDSGDIAFTAGLSGAAPRQALVLVAGGSLTTLAAVGQPAPGQPQGTIARLSGLNMGSLGAGGVVCGTSMDGGAVADSVVQYPAAGVPQVLMTTAAPLPPGGVITLRDDATPSRMVQARINRSGDLVFAADVGGYGRALFRNGADGPELLTPLGQGRNGALDIRSVTAFDLNDSGQIAYLGVHDEADQDTAIVATSLAMPENAQVMAATGQALPTTPAQTIASLGPPLMDAAGGVVFAAQGAAGDSGDPEGFLLHATPGHLDLLAAEGQAIAGVGTLSGSPDAAPGSLSTAFSEVQLNRSGQVLFLSSYLDGPTGTFVPAGLFLLSGGAIQAVALPGQKSPLAGSPTYLNLISPRLSDGGTVSFSATVLGPRRKISSGLFQQSGPAARALIASGDPVPGLDATQFQAFTDPTVNAAGDLAFGATLNPPPATGSASALFVSTGGVTRLALQDGDPVDTLAGATISMNDILPAAPLSLADDGTLLVAARLQGAPAPDGLFIVLQ